ncbi:CAP-Gly domain-containing linker protein 1-like isoform X2 [Rhopalosiphum padi]|uniref:CAP-Gly domain-containing linker protein 1-like isoform X2 n=1 Tax=Rhopalosiphum padi TaxID=40932 RepID=UPI00298E8E61|nr:CAP-Gly domain-containing linker protein 1-like isoform X2 [Rhopalosiphum padi]
MNNKDQSESVLHSNDGPYSEEIIGQYTMELPVFSNKKINSTQNQQRKKKKVLKPIRMHTLSATRRRQCVSNSPYLTTYTSCTGARSNSSNVNNLLINDHILRIKKLENELIEAHMKTRELIVENRLLKTLEKRQENALSMYEGKQAKLPQAIKSYEEEIRTLKSQIRQIKISFKEMENRYKSQNIELIALHKQYKHLLSLSQNKQLSKKENLSDQLEEAQSTIKKQDDKILNVMKKLELQNKSHRYHRNVENIKIKELQHEVKRLEDENKKLRSCLDKLKNKNYGSRQSFTKGITEDSISIISRVLKPIQTIHDGQGDVIDASFYKTNESISLKPETFHEDQEENRRYSMKNNKESYTSTTPSSMSWIENDMTKLTKENQPELIKTVKNDFENKIKHKATAPLQVPGTSMTRSQKDILLAKLNQVSEDKDNYENYYKSKLLKQTINKRYSSYDSDNISGESSNSDSSQE